MLDRIQAVLGKLKEIWQGLSDKIKKTIKRVAVIAIILMVALTAYSTYSASQWKEIFPNMEAEEAMEVHAAISNLGYSAQMEGDSVVKVPVSEYDTIVYEMSLKGYPEDSLSYGIFQEFTGLTSTEFEKKQALIFQLQENIENTISSWHGISDVKVTLAIPEDDDLVLSSSPDEAGASVTVTPDLGETITPENVTAIKNHVSTAVTNLSPNNVTVIDQSTGTMPPSLTESSTMTGTDRVAFERSLEAHIEANVTDVLNPIYGVGEYNAVAKVVVDYSTLVKEMKEYDPEGTLELIEESYQGSDDDTPSGIVGEEDNTDTPIYPNDDGLAGEDIINFDRVRQYAISYVLEQSTSEEPIITGTTVAVTVNDPELTEEEEARLIEQVRQSANVPLENVAVWGIEYAGDDEEPVGPTDPEIAGLNLMSWAIIGGAALLGLLCLFILYRLITRKKRKRKKLEEEERKRQLEEQGRLSREQEIAEHKRMLQEEALENSTHKEDAITHEVQDFAQKNPELTANLIRSLMKDD